MLRHISHSFISPRLIAFRYDGGASITNKLGIGDFTFTRNGADNLAYLDLLSPFSRNPIVVAAVGTNVADGGYPYIDIATAAPTGKKFYLGTLDASAAADAGTVYGLILGHDNTDTHAHGVRCAKVVTTRHKPRIMGFSLTDAGFVASVGGETQAAIVNSGTAGENTLTFNTAFASNDVIAVCSQNALDGSCLVESIGAKTLSLKAFDATGAAADKTVDVIVVGFDTLTDHGGQRQPLFGTMISQRLLGFVVDGTGTASITIGGDDATLVDNGAGNYTLTFTHEFARTPIVVATGYNSKRACVTAKSATAITVKTSNNAGVAGDGLFSCLVLGSDYSIQQ